jgi:hypothetical protein
MPRVPSLVIFTASAVVVACGPKSEPNAPPPAVTAPTSTAEPEPPAPPTTPEPEAAKGEVKTMYVDAELVDCEGEGPMKCMRVRESESEDWTLFYSPIEGFEHEAGNTYELRVEVLKVDDPPADGSSLRYRLVEVVSKTPAK